LGKSWVLSGEAGIGKSRLIKVLKDHIADEPHTKLECRSSPYFTNSALYPIIDMVQRTLRFQVDDTPETRLEKLVHNLSQYRLPLEETVPLFASLLSLPVPEDQYPPLTLSPQRQRQKTLEAIVAITLELSEQQPVLFILEDGHWLDASTQELLGFLIDQVPTSPILVLITYRPEFQPTWGNRSYLTQVTLNRLSRSQVESIATQVAGGKTLPSEVIEQLVDKTDGVPLYVEEMTKAVLESGVLKETDSHYELTGSVASLSIPATLQDSLMARLDRLVTAKAVAQYASVIGRQFSYELLQAVSDLDEATLQLELGRLVDAELVYQRGLPAQSTYVFKHALIQDTAYESLLRSTRQGYHRRIAEVLEAQFPDTTETQPELLAHHYTEAGLTEQAIGYWQQAGQRASDRSSYQEAIGHLTTGLSLLRTLPETLERHQQELPLQTALGAASLMTRGHAAPEMETAYTQARILCQQLGDTQDVFPVLHGLWRVYVARPNYPLARQLGEELLRLAEQRQETPLYVMAHSALGATCLYLGELRLARRHLEAAIVRYTPALFGTGYDPGVHCHVSAALTLWLLGYPDQSLMHAHNGIALAIELEHAFNYAYALIFASSVRLLRREEQEVYNHTESAITLSTEQGFTQWLANSTIQRGWALTARGQQEEGLTQLRQGLTDFRATGADLAVPYFLTLLAEGYSNLKQVKEGLGALREAVEVM
jgi:predicted ATPase